MSASGPSSMAILTIEDTFEFRHFQAYLHAWKNKGLITDPEVHPFPHFSMLHTARLLGFGDQANMRDYWDHTTLKTLENLTTSNGFALYSVLLVKRGMKEEN